MKLTDAEQKWLERRPKIVVGDVVGAMNTRYAEYVSLALAHDKIDAQVRADFEAFGSAEVVFMDGAEPPYSR